MNKSTTQTELLRLFRMMQREKKSKESPGLYHIIMSATGKGDWLPRQSLQKGTLSIPTFAHVWVDEVKINIKSSK